MVDNVSDIETEIEALILKCKKDPKFKGSPDGKKKILEYSKKIDNELQDISKNIASH
jgi:hypothetical protein